MEQKDLDKIYKEIELSVYTNKLNVAFTWLSHLGATIQNYAISHDIEELNSNYSTMLYYYFDGAVDPERQNVYDSIRRKLLDINDQIRINQSKQTSSSYFFEKIRLESIRNTNLAQLIENLIDINDRILLNELLPDENDRKSKNFSLNKDKESLNVSIFDSIISLSKLSVNDYETLKKALNSEQILLQEKSLILSAIFLNTLFVFDILKVQLLLDKVVSDNALIAARALVAIIIILQYYKERIKLYPQVKGQIEALSENSHIQQIFTKIVIQLIRARETERISKKMMDEIIPEMVKLSKIADKKINLDDIVNEGDFLDKNPEWKNINDENMSKKLREYSEMQSEGFDVFHSTFASLKSFPFFYELSNWFLIFDINYSGLSEINSSAFADSVLVKAIASSPQMCNSDKYSLFFSLLQAPESHRKMMLEGLGGNIEQLKELEADKKWNNTNLNFETYSNQYIQDLYRFFKLNKRKIDFVDIFDISIDTSNDGVLSYFIKKDEDLLQIANYCFEKNMYREALGFIDKVIENGENTAQIWEMKGYCLQMENRQTEALSAYLRADIIHPDKIWTLKRIAQIYKLQNNFSKAIEYYEQILIITPDVSSIILNLGQCYYQISEYDKALNCYYKVELIDKTTIKTKRAIAWISFLIDKLDISENYYQYLLENNPSDEDYLNAGHIQIVKGNIKKALEYYKISFNRFESKDAFFKTLEEDQKILLNKNVDPNFVRFLADYLKMK